ncbi:MAG TPA: crosslink repair DNA glycosylase YcaQ family protein [Chloroflexota bacterium]|jgi:hypothetical protein|nr:crosslink repair DNA glycosylase YcaQ family protein [Chloroflexota bacterium]
MRLTTTEARRVLLAAQGLSTRPRRRATKPDVLSAIRTMGALQIDTINVVARSPYLVLWSRIGDYKSEWLNDHLATGALFEYWSHAACFLPIADHRLYRPFAEGEHPRWNDWASGNAGVIAHVREFAHQQKEVRSSDFKRTDGGKGGWWGWKPEKIALEYLFLRGELMVARRDRGFQRVYAPRECVLPDATREPALSRDDAIRELAARSIQSLGVTRPEWIADYFRLRKRGMETVLKGLINDGEVLPVEVDGWNGPGYAHRDSLGLVEAAAEGGLKGRVTTFLSPFDPIVWDRRRATGLFGFDYRIEVYTPREKRRFGYFTMPILHRDALVGRIDAKAHRSEELFEIRALHLEEGVRMTDHLLDGLVGAVRSCAAWHKTPEIKIEYSDPRDLAATLSGLLAA